MLCFVTLPNSIVLEVQLSTTVNGNEKVNANGQACLDKVCEKLGIVEVDYFGLQSREGRPEEVWLNLRNELSRESLGFPPPFHFRLRVKFFVEPHYIQQEVTREQFYWQLRDDLDRGDVCVQDLDVAAQLGALMAQAEHGDLLDDCDPRVSYQNIVRTVCKHKDDDSRVNFLSKLVSHHALLRGTSRSHARYRFLQEMAATESYGAEYHRIRKGPEGAAVVAVGPTGVTLCRENNECIKQIEYPAIHVMTLTRKTIIMQTIRDDGSSTTLQLHLSSREAAGNLYRSVTEMFSFFRCDSVHDEIATQFSRDLKGMLASLFNENTTLGKNYLFDIRRTFREAYDHARRLLYHSNDLPGDPSKRSDVVVPTESNEDDSQTIMHKYSVLRERLTCRQNALLCRVCMSADVSCAFCPCGHVLCCAECAQRLRTCPVCRQNVDRVQTLYLSAFHLDPDTELNA